MTPDLWQRVCERLAQPLPESPAALAARLKALPLSLSAPRPLAEAISTAGGISFDAPEGTVTLDGENHHISKPGHIGKINAENQFDIVWSSDGVIEPDPYLDGYDWFPADVRDALVASAG